MGTVSTSKVNLTLCQSHNIVLNLTRHYTLNCTGDGDAFADFLQENYPAVSNNCLSRAEYSNRQDWSLEVSWELFPLLEPLLDYVVKTLLDDANILRDSVLIQIECIYFEAYVHVNAILWRVVFRELRALTNGKGPQLSPLALNGLYEYMYDLGLMLQTDKSLSVFDNHFRPWPHIYLDRGRAAKFYKGLDANLEQDIARLRNFEARADSLNYIGLIRTVLKLFGMDIIDSFTNNEEILTTNTW